VSKIIFEPMIKLRDMEIFLTIHIVVYCSAVYVCPKLGIIGKRRKTQPVSDHHRQISSHSVTRQKQLGFRRFFESEAIARISER
jgi:hypothetical protein